MSNIVDEKALQKEQFTRAIQEYKDKEKNVSRTFLEGVLDLGEILARQKAIWKPKKQWTSYLNEIGKTMAGANQYIRLYEYSKTNPDILKNEFLFNWEMANSFLALTEELREQLVWSLDGKELSPEEFKEEVRKITPPTERVEETLEVVNPSSDIREKIVERVNLEKVYNLAKQYVAKLMQTKKDVTENSIPYVASLFNVSAGIREMRDKNKSNLLTAAEKKIWIKIVQKQVKELQDIEQGLMPKID